MAQQVTPATPALSPGQRILYAGSRGTVRFIGELQGRAGTWIGVEWDDESRGKHDGEVDGVRYFHCHRPGTGSFVRPSTKLSTGSSFLEALRGKYLGDGSDSTSAASTSVGKTLADVQIEAPNLDKVRRRLGQLGKLRAVGLEGSSDPSDADAGCHVSRALGKGESPGSIQAICPNIITLDLSRSLLSSWTELAGIAAELPRLETLTFHFNRLAPLDSSETIPSGAFVKLRELRIDGNDITWQEILRLEPHLPALETLQCGYNGIAHLGETANAFSALRELNLEGNQLSSWEEIVAGLGSLPRLEKLLLTSNPLARVPSPTAASSSARPFPALRHISLGGTPLSSWSDLACLDAWLRLGRDKGAVVGGRGLRSLRVALPDGRRTLLPDLDAKLFRPLCIVLLPALEQLDGGDITRAERLDAELHFVSRFTPGLEGIPEQDLDLFRARHQELALAHGTDATSRPAQAPAPSQTTLQGKLIGLTAHATQQPPSASPPHLVTPSHTASVKLLPSSTVRQARVKIQRALGVKGPGQLWALLAPALEQQDADEGRICFELDDPSREIDHYGLSSGDDVIFVSATTS